MSKLIWLLFSFTYSFSVTALGANNFSEPQVYKVKSSSGSGYKFYVFYRENKIYFADEFFQPKQGFQMRLDQHQFHSQQDLEEFKNSLNIEPKTIGLLGLSDRFDTYNMVTTELTNEVIWPTTQVWNMDWEKKYAEWVAENIDDHFHERHGISTDCADVPISLRWIFARINGLPAAQSLAGSRALFTNESMRAAWQNLPTAREWHQDRRFLAALNYVLENTYTHSLYSDSYPVLINRTYFMPGVHLLDLSSEDTGHTLFVFNLNQEEGGVGVIYSTIPRDLRSLAAEIYFQAESFEEQKRGGFFKIRWPVRDANGCFHLVERSQMPGFSLMQYQSEFMRGHDLFSDAVEAHLSLMRTPIVKMRTGIAALKGKLTTRVKIVNDGYAFCKTHDCSPNTSNYETWSTPSRDLRISLLVDNLESIYQNSSNAQLDRLWEDFKEESFNLQDEAKSSFSIEEIVSSFSNRNYSSDPRSSILLRWGFEN